MRKYTFKLVIQEGSDEFWDALPDSGCNEIAALLEDALFSVGLDNSTLTLEKFENADI